MGGASTVGDWLAMAMEVGRRRDAEISGGEGEDDDSPQQREAVERGVHVVERFGGVLLADAVGLGKTRIAVEMARRLVRRSRRRGGGPAGPALILSPARLRKNWEQAVARAGWQLGRDVMIDTHHRMSRKPWEGRPAVVIVDEAHRFRNPQARRSRNLARLAAKSQVILVTATPVCTSRADLGQLLSYFLSDEATKALVGMNLAGAFAADEAGEFDVVELLEEVAIRRTEADFGAGGRPGIRFSLLEFEASADEAWLWRNLEPTLRGLAFAATGEYWPGGLLVHNLLKMWESGADALWVSLEELVHFHERWMEAARAGKSLERPGFRALFSGVDRRQQVFSFVFDAGEQPLSPERIRAVADDLQRLRDLHGRVEAVRGVQSGLVQAIVDEVLAKKQSRFLIFSAYRASAMAIFEALKSQAPREAVGLIKGEEAWMSGLGRSSAQEVLARFSADQREGESLRVLVATDCISEGVNLQHCSRLILADLPYSPVRLEQRIGRIARPGSGARAVTVYLPRPRSWTDSLGMRRRLSGRLDLARAMGAGHDLAEVIQGSSEEENEGPGPLEAMTLEERIRGLLRGRKGVNLAPAFARVDSSCGEEELWARVLIRGSVERSLWLRVRPGDRQPVVRLSEQIKGLARLADDERRIEAFKACGPRWEMAQRWVERRRQSLEAARLAPPLLGRGSEAVWLWRRLREAVQQGAVAMTRGEIEEARRRLLRAHRGGQQVEMEELCLKEPSPRSIARFVAALPPAETCAPTEIDLVCALWVPATAA